MEQPRNIEGTEFDWFATDRDGSFAIFATAGCGPVPESILGLAKAHDAVAEGLKVHGWGTGTVWQSYSRIGLYAYDWSDGQSCYIRVAEPANSLPLKLAADIAAISRLPKIEASFSAAATIQPAWQDEAI
jgi:hypothetical protein